MKDIFMCLKKQVIIIAQTYYKYSVVKDGNQRERRALEDIERT
jgi:hypothetical protein